MAYQSKQVSPSETTLTLIREMAVAELGAIKTYKYHLLQSDNEKLNAYIQELLNDEEKHYKILMELLRKYDINQSKFYFMAQSTVQNINDFGNLYASSGYNVIQSLINELSGEHSAIIEYTDILYKIKNPEIREKIMSIIDEEKEHTEILTKLISEIDK